MMIRFVKMTFQHDKTDDFISIFTDAQNNIASFPGCGGVDLLRDILHPHIFFTYSLWKDAESLDQYRKSQLFYTTWEKTKVLFADKPEAWSVEKMM
ncbi:MAG: antibiotic biosynthesis monooxygenase [Chitinophagales bacterium]|nr:antibiotic biosynthesis monooxygenase [Chitinophagales bacterium]